MSAVASVALHRPVAAEEAARANFYALLARLLHSAPDGAVLALLAEAEPLPDDARPDLRAAWQGLVDASKAMDADAAAEEYERLFVAVGKAPVSIYAGHYAGAAAVDHPRVRIQQDLAGLGLARPATVSEPEDHLAGLMDVMRVLAAGGAGRAAAELSQQKHFFDTHLAIAAPRFFCALAAAGQANYYRHVAALGRAFMAVEAESFELE